MNKVVILEDKVDLAYLISALKKYNYQIHTFKLVENLYFSIRSIKPQIIILSYNKKFKRFYKKILRGFSFIPTIFYNSKSLNIKKGNIHTLTLPFEEEKIKKILDDIEDKNPAEETIWDKNWQTNRKVVKYQNLKIFINIGLILILFAVLLALFPSINKKFRIFEKDVEISLLPSSNPSSICFQKNKFWLCDWYAQTIYKLDENLKVEKMVYFPEKHITSITFAKEGETTFIYSCDTWNKLIYKHNLDKDLTIISSFELPSHGSPLSIASDGEYFWILEGDTIYKTSIGKKIEILKIHTFANKKIVSIFSDRKYVYFLDSTENKIFKHKNDENLTLVKVFSLPISKIEKPSGFSIDRNHAWICVEKESKLYRCKLK